VSSLAGRVAVVTGAARDRSIGGGIARVLARHGADVVVNDLAVSEQGERRVAEIEALGRRAALIAADVTDYPAAEGLMAQAVERMGRLDIVVANAGIAPVFGTTGLAADAWTDAIDVLLTGVYLTLDVAVPTIVAQDQGGSIVITSSTAGLKGIGRNLAATSPGMIGYTAAKHGVVGLMRLYANLLAPHRIRVNTLHPTGVNTPMVVNEQFNRFLEEFPNAGDAMQNALPVQLVEPEDIANAAAWLCSDEARYITGVTLPVDAGFTVR
jgi:NAD(P)-dependent dehydrogenase (short-subunit alcohol dehydrogenase family)